MPKWLKSDSLSERTVISFCYRSVRENCFWSGKYQGKWKYKFCDHPVEIYGFFQLYFLSIHKAYMFLQKKLFLECLLYFHNNTLYWEYYRIASVDRCLVYNFSGTIFKWMESLYSVSGFFLGPQQVGRREIRERLIMQYPERFGAPLPRKFCGSFIFCLCMF